MTGERAYRALLLLYPRGFRREYRDQMLQLYRDERRDRAASWARLAGDVFVSAPVQYKETLRIMHTTGKLVTAAIVTTAGIAVTAIVGGAFATLLLMVLLAWILVALLKDRGARPARGFGWKLAAIGAGTFAVAFVFFAGPWPDSWREAVPGDVAWGVGFFVFVISIVMVVAGMMTALVEWAGRRRLTN
jgi:hypothetical protein